MNQTMRLRTNRDLIANITKNGETLHTGVRMLRSTDGRIGVFLTKTDPPVVYAAGEVEFQPVRTPCSCKGDVAKSKLVLLWSNSEPVTA